MGFYCKLDFLEDNQKNQELKSSTNTRNTLYLADLSHLKPLCVMSKRHGNRRNKHKWRKTKRHNFMNPEGINALPKACDRNFNIKRQCCQNSLVTRSAGSILKIRDSTMQVSEWKSYRKDGFNFKNLLFFKCFRKIVNIISYLGKKQSLRLLIIWNKRLSRSIFYMDLGS